MTVPGPTSEPVGDRPTVADVLAAGNAVLADWGEPSVALRHLQDHRLLERILPSWRLVCSEHAYRNPRVLFQWGTEDWWLLVQATGVLRLLRNREWSDLPYFRLSAEPGSQTLWMCATSDDLIDHALYLHQRGTWSTNLLIWLLTVMPGDRAEAERILLSLH